MTKTESMIQTEHRPNDEWQPHSYRRPDGTVRTIIGSTKGVVIIDRQHTDEVHEYDEVIGNRFNLRPSVIESVVGQNPDAPSVTFPIAAWAGLDGGLLAEVKPERIECDECNGTGRTECPHCDQDMDCEECDGSGWIGDVPEPPLRAVKYLDRWFNTAIISPLLRLVPGETMTVRQQTKNGNLLLKGDGWEGAVAMLLDENCVKEVAELPT